MYPPCAKYVNPLPFGLLGKTKDTLTDSVSLIRTKYQYRHHTNTDTCIRYIMGEYTWYWFRSHTDTSMGMGIPVRMFEQYRYWYESPFFDRYWYECLVWYRYHYGGTYGTLLTDWHTPRFRYIDYRNYQQVSIFLQ